MAYAVFLRNPTTGYHYRRSIWYRDIEEAEMALNSWIEVAEDCATVDLSINPVLVEDSYLEGEVT